MNKLYAQHTHRKVPFPKVAFPYFRIGKWLLCWAVPAVSAFLCATQPAAATPRALYSAETNILAETITIHGIVKDNTGPLPGVSVKVKETGKATVTDLNGRYVLTAPANGTLIYTFIGYTTLEIPINKRTSINATLSQDLKMLNDVVVVGYGTQSREKLIGSVAQVTGEKLAERPVAQLKDALSGQLPGVIITQRGGRPGGTNGNISVRGVGSFGASPDALILVDGIIANNFDDIDPNDVESISVLKDASSAAIYGSRAANGVILVTTKAGRNGKPQVSLSSYGGVQVATTLPEYVNSWEYQQLYYEAQNGTSVLTAAQQAEVEKYRAQNDPNYPNNNYLKYILSKNGKQTGNNVSISGGTNVNKYDFSLGYLYQDGLVVRNDFSRYNVRFNMTTAISPKLDVTTRVAAIATKTNEPIGPAGGYSGGLLNMIGQAARLNGTLIDRYPNGDYGAGLASTGTTVSDLETPSFFKDKSLNLNGNLKVDYKPVAGLKLSFISGYRSNTSRDRTFRSTQRLNNLITLGPNVLLEETGNNEYYTLQGLADYSKQIHQHYFSILAGYSFENYTSDNFSASRDNLPGNDLTVLVIGSPNNPKASGTGDEYALESQFARANYNYAGKYLIEGVVRRDGSSRFPTSNKYAVFPSVAVGWRISQEPFFKKHVKWVNELKIKASRGVLGNQNISNYPYQNTLVSNSSTTYVFGNQITPGAARTRIVDSTLHWESTRTQDVGLEAGLFNNKLNFSVTYFDRYTYDILYPPSGSVSNVLGFNLSQQNTGSLSNKGFEFTLSHSNHIGKFSYNLSGNLTILHNKVLDLGVGNIYQPNGLIGNNSDKFIGYPASNGTYDLYYGYVADGLFTDAQDIADFQKANNQKNINPTPKPGDVRYLDISGPNGVPDGVVDATYDRVILGSQIPKYSYGFSLGGSFQGFDASVLLQGIAGVQNRLTGYAAWALYNTTGNIQRWQYDERWTEQNPNRYAKYPRMENIPGGGVPNTTLSSYWIQNGAYMRIKNAQLGYTFPGGLLKKVGLSTARIYLSGENLHTFSKYEKGWDPELVGNENFYPIVSTYSLGLNIKF